MNPGGGWRGLSELGYLAFWWAAWSLGDFYLLDWSPWSELWVLGLLGGSNHLLVERFAHEQRTQTREIAIELKE